MKSAIQATSTTHGRQRTISEAARLYDYIGYYEEYFEDVWKATRGAGDENAFPGDAYSLAEYAFARSAGQTTNRLRENGKRPDDLLTELERSWPEGCGNGDNVVLNVWVDKDRVYPVIAEKACDVLQDWQTCFTLALDDRAKSAEKARAAAAKYISELAGGYLLATAYRNRSHFLRALNRVRKEIDV